MKGKRNKKYWIIVSIITLLLLLPITKIVFFGYIAWARQNGTDVRYEGKMFSSNGEYTGVIDEYKNRVSILDQSQKEVSGIDIDKYGNCPKQIVLGEKTYFLLYYQYGERGDTKIVQYDFQSVKKQEYIAENAAVIDYKDGYLFTGNWKDIGQYFFGYDDYIFYANNYIEEEKFGEQLKQLKQDDSGKCIIGNIELYYYEDGYFSTEPSLNDYPGMSKGNFKIGYKDYQAETEQEINDRNLILSEIGYMDADCEIFEYQIANNIYGLCNVYEKGRLIQTLPREVKYVKASYFYKINPEENEITLLLKKDSCMGLVLSEDEAIYQENNRIMHYNFQTGDEKEIYQINNQHGVEIYIKRGYLMVVEERNRVVSAVFPSNKEIKSVVKWAQSAVPGDAAEEANEVNGVRPSRRHFF